MAWFSHHHSSSHQSAACIIKMEGIRKVYAKGSIRVEALRGISLEINRGELVAVVGASGSGKSTLLNLLGCLDTPSGGEYFLSGEAVASLDRDGLAKVRNQRVGFVFQNFNLLPQLSALENVEMPMLFGGVPARQRRERARSLLAQVGLGERENHKPTELSGGQMQRVAVARALSMEPDILLADEPTGNLDTRSGSDVLSLLTELWEKGRTVIVVTHDLALAERAPRVLELRDGSIVRNSQNGGDSRFYSDGSETPRTEISA